MKTIGLCMIVKNEGHVILRCLESVRPFVDYVLIEDTGSTDGTQDIIRHWLDSVGIPGTVVDEPWRDFAANRTDVLAKLREHSEVDYALMIDADDTITMDGGFALTSFKASMTADFYDVEIRHGPMKHHRPQIFRNSLNFTYGGALHEFAIVPEGASARATAAGFHITIIGGGARSQDEEKVRRDAALLENALRTENDAFLISRYTFYLAQSYRDAGEKEKALDAYLRRVHLGYWDQEIFCALYKAAQLKEELGHAQEEIIALYLRASKTAPDRAEALHGLSRFYRSTKRYREGYEIAKRGLALAPAGGALFVEVWVYEHGLLDEYAVNAYWAGHFQESLDACARILVRDDLDQRIRDRVSANAEFARAKLVRVGDSRDDGAKIALTQLMEVHLINLDRSTNRLSVFMERNAHLRHITRVAGVDGKLVDRLELIRSRDIDQNLSYSLGSLGRSLSHIGLWKKAVLQNRVVTVFEDDVICSQEFESEAGRVLSELPDDWGIILWGYIFDPSFMWVDLQFSKAKLEFYDYRILADLEGFPTTKFSHSAIRLLHSDGLQAYSVSPKGAKALLEICLPLRDQFIPYPGTGIVISNKCIDNAMCAAYGEMQAFACIPPLVIQDYRESSDRIALDEGAPTFPTGSAKNTLTTLTADDSTGPQGLLAPKPFEATALIAPLGAAFYSSESRAQPSLSVVTRVAQQDQPMRSEEGIELDALNPDALGPETSSDVPSLIFGDQPTSTSALRVTPVAELPELPISLSRHGIGPSPSKITLTPVLETEWAAIVAGLRTASSLVPPPEGVAAEGLFGERSGVAQQLRPVQSSSLRRGRWDRAPARWVLLVLTLVIIASVVPASRFRFASAIGWTYSPVDRRSPWPSSADALPIEDSADVAKIATTVSADAESSGGQPKATAFTGPSPQPGLETTTGPSAAIVANIVATRPPVIDGAAVAESSASAPNAIANHEPRESDSAARDFAEPPQRAIAATRAPPIAAAPAGETAAAAALVAVTSEAGGTAPAADKIRVLSNAELERLGEEVRQALLEGRISDAQKKMADLERQLKWAKQGRVAARPSEPSKAAEVPLVARALPATVAALLQRGDAMLRQGDVLSARLFFERAAAAGSGQGALYAGKTYDPNFLATIDAPGFQSDPARAVEWYRIASIILGDLEADALVHK